MRKRRQETDALQHLLRTLTIMVWNMGKKSDKEIIAELTGCVDELTEVLSALIRDIDDHRSLTEDTHSCYWWRQSFVKDLEVSDETKAKLGFPPEGYKNDEEGDY